MKKAIFAAASGLLLAAAPIQAQETAPVPVAPTMQDDLDCAIFLAYILGSMEETEANEEEKTGVMIGLIFSSDGTRVPEARISKALCPNALKSSGKTISHA